MALEDLVRYESAAVADSKVGKENDLAVLAMDNFYKSILGKDAGDCTIFNEHIQKAYAGTKSKSQSISDYAILQDMEIFSGKYKEGFVTTKISDLTKYLSDGYKIPEEASKGLGEYGNLTIKDLAEKSKNKEISEEEKKKIAKAIEALETLKERKLNASALKIYNNLTTKELESLYPKPEKKEGEK